MKLQLNIDVDYKPWGTTEAELVSVLQAAAEHLLDNGLLTRNTTAEVVSCTHEARRSRRDIVTWRLPESAANPIIETLKMDSESPAFDKELRGQIAYAIEKITEVT